MKVEYLREFVVFSKYLNFSRAAKKLYMSQPLLSYHISSTEQELGIQLVNRDGALSLTPAGETFLAEAENIVRAYDAMLEKCKAVSTTRSGKLVIERPTATADIETTFETIVASFSSLNPQVNISFSISEKRHLADVLLSGNADLGVLYDRIPFKGHPEMARLAEFKPLPPGTVSERYVWVHKDHPLAKKEAVGIADLAGCLHLMPASVGYEVMEQAIDQIFKNAGATLEMVHRPISFMDCVLTIGEEEVLVLAEEDIDRPLFRAVPDRVFKKLESGALKFDPVFVYLESNENPALREFLDFIDSVNNAS